eukprot:TRINITY_DN1474_c0_g1_i1.p1 TRINITY_DN1474_c0_g1~~TRINITY_DN1474_c0_g1_i1.p1  ORF type:complete len:305 (-),score=72.94 TRINITY_DN1474_c0_g1_i1:69-983(-)
MSEATKSGYIEMKKKGLHAVFCVLVEGSFYYYKTATDPAPKGGIDLQGCTFSEIGKDAKKKDAKLSFVIKDKDGKELFVGAVGTQSDLESWKKEIEAAFEKEPGEAPDLTSPGKKSKTSVAMKMKKGAASKTAKSAMGKKVMKAIVNEETTTLLNASKALVQAESGDAKKAEDLEKGIVKIAVKAYLLVENKDLKGSDFLKADAPLRNAFNLLVKVFNGRRRAKRERVVEALQKVEVELQTAQKVIVDLMSPHISSKNMMSLTNIFSTIGNLKFLETIFYDDSIVDELEKLIDAMDYYTQFHYH